MKFLAKLLSCSLIIFAGCSLEVENKPTAKPSSALSSEPDTDADVKVRPSYPTRTSEVDAIDYLPPAPLFPPRSFPSGSGGNNSASLGCHDADLDGVCDEDDKCADFDDSIDIDSDGSPDRCDCNSEDPEVFIGSLCAGSSDCLILTCDPLGSGECLTSVADQGTTCFDPQAPIGDSCTVVESTCNGEGSCLSETIDNSCCCKDCDLGTASFSGGPDDWYEIDTLSYPTGVLLSQNRNQGVTKGGVTLTPLGLQIDEEGTYWVTISSILLNQEDPEDTPFIQIFLVRNGIFDPINIQPEIATVGSTPFGLITNLQGSGFLMDVPPGTSLSLFATNGGSPEPEPLTVISWNISLYKICD